MKILITGAAGFIGYHLTQSLLQDGHEVLGIDNINDYYDQKIKYARIELLKSSDNFIFKKIDITNKKLIENSFNSFVPKKVVNLAAQPGVRYSMINPHAYFESNLQGFLNIIELCKYGNVENFIYASSSSVYGGKNNFPFDVNDKLYEPLSLYGITKRANELIAKSYSSLYGINTTGLRYFTVYGPWYRPDMAMFIFIKKMILGEYITLYNNGNMKRDFTYIDDIINGTKLAIGKNFDCEIFNLGNNKPEGLMKMIHILENELNLKAKINYEPLQNGDLVETHADIDYSKNMLGYLPNISLEKGIPKLVEWYKEYYRC